MPNAVETLRKTKTVLKTGGWVKEEFHAEGGQHCLLGALEDVVYGHKRATISFGQDVLPELDALSSICERILTEAISDTQARKRAYMVPPTIISFNDDARTAWPDVLEVVNKAIELAEKEEENG